MNISGAREMARPCVYGSCRQAKSSFLHLHQVAHNCTMTPVSEIQHLWLL